MSKLKAIIFTFVLVGFACAGTVYLLTDHHVKQVMLTMPNFRENLYAAQQMRKLGLPVYIAATAKYEDEIDKLKAAGADAVFNLYTEAGTGFVSLAWETWEKQNSANEACKPVTD